VNDDTPPADPGERPSERVRAWLGAARRGGPRDDTPPADPGERPSERVRAWLGAARRGGPRDDTPPADPGERPATPRLAALAVVSAALAIAGAPWALDAPALVFAFKPLATLAIIAFALTRADAAPPRAQRRWIVAGLVFSLAGDIALLWPQQGFVPGLVAFLVAHLCYLVAFTRDVRFVRAAPLAFAVYALIAGGLLARLWPDVPPALRAPVLAYVACLAAMAAQAAARARALRATPHAALARRAAIGGALFVCSDALLAFNRFSVPLPAASLWILATYWAAQWCIASSLPVRGAGTNAANATTLPPRQPTNPQET
jgi:uncharacterized membrane protein YhhN